LKSNLHLAAQLIILDNFEIIDDNPNHYRIVVKNDQNNKSYQLYLQNVILPRNLILELRQINNLWVSGIVTVGQIEFLGINKNISALEYCDLNIEKDTELNIFHELKLTDVNCLNNAGKLNANSTFVSYNSDHAEMYLLENSYFISTSSMIIAHSKNLTIFQYGILGANRFHIITSGNFYNRGEIIFGNNAYNTPHKMMVSGFFNYREGSIISNSLESSDLQIYTRSSSGSLGTMSAINLSFSALSKGLNDGIFYNDGNITVVKNFDFRDKSFFLNDKNGNIISQNKLRVKLVNDIVHIYYSGSILSRGGIIEAIDANLDVNTLLVKNTHLFLNNATTSAKAFVLDAGSIILSNISSSSNTSFLFMNQDNNTLAYIRTLTHSTSDTILISDMKHGNELHGNFMLPGSNNTAKLTANMATSAITNLVPSDTGSRIQFVGNWSFNNGYIGTNQGLFLSHNIKVNLTDLISFKNLTMNKNSLLAVDNYGDVYVRNLWTDNAQITSFGNITVNERINAFDKLTLEGNV
ncbi:MAG: hypothetical protein AABY27_01555, partial [Pseudomonadota bacterium]